MDSELVQIIPVIGTEHLPTVRTLLLEYAAWLKIDLCFQGFAEELATLPGAYVPPGGRLYIVTCSNETAGCVALRPFAKRIGEMKRLYVREQFRGCGLGRRLTQLIIEDSRGIGYQTLRLDTLPIMGSAIGLYRSLGFKEIAPYRMNPVEGALFFELNLRT